MMRLVIGKKMDQTKMFAHWRIDAPWQPITKKSQGMRMGSGKGGIDHYVTPIKAGRCFNIFIYILFLQKIYLSLYRKFLQPNDIRS